MSLQGVYFENEKPSGGGAAASSSTLAPTPAVPDKAGYDEEYVKDLRKEAAANRTLAQDMQKLTQALLEKLAGTEGGELPKKEVMKTAKGQELSEQLAQQFAIMEKRFADFEAAAKQRELEALRTKIALRYGLDDPLAARLVGASAEELEADAKKLAGALQQRGRSALGNPAGEPPLTIETLKEMTPEQINRNWQAVSETLKHRKG
jgi:hypothetical protein